MRQVNILKSLKPACILIVAGELCRSLKEGVAHSLKDPNWTSGYWKTRSGQTKNYQAKHPQEWYWVNNMKEKILTAINNLLSEKKRIYKQIEKMCLNGKPAKSIVIHNLIKRRDDIIKRITRLQIFLFLLEKCENDSA
jgi:hypothetical protein